MRLEITRRTDLATRALLELMGETDRLKAVDLAERIGTTAGFLSQVLAPLGSRGWVRSDPGPTGGYRLVADPDELTVLDVIEAVEGPTDTGRCVLEDRTCGGQGPCPLHVPWSAARAHLLADLGATSIGSLAGSSS